MGKGKSKKKTILLLSVGCILLLAIGGLFVQKKVPIMELLQHRTESRVKPDQLLEQYYSDIEKGKYEEMYRMLEKKSREKISKENFISRNQRIYEGIQAKNIRVKATDVEKSRKEGTTVQYEVTMDTVAGKVSFSNQAVFQAGQEKENPYMLHWEDSMIFPELTSGDKVKVSREEAKRGRILDRNGVVLAGEGTASLVGLVPGKMREDSSQDIGKLAEITGISPEEIRKRLGAKWVTADSFVPLKTVEKLTQPEKLSEEPDEKTTRKKERDEALLSIPGVMLSDTEIRQYPIGKASSHLIGYLQKVTAEDLKKHPGEGYHENSMIGRSGMEGLYEKELKGQDGVEIAIVDSAGQKKDVPASIAKQDGKDIALTIDSNLQQNIYQNFVDEKSCSAAMNPYTGEVLALVSTPTFDGNDLLLGMSDESWNSLKEEEGNPLMNRFRQKLCPGSSFKPIIAAIGLKTGTIDPQEDFGSTGLDWQKDSSWGNYHVTTLHAAKPAVLQNALICSDNVYFARAALKIGREKLQAGLDELGFGKKLPFEISVAESQYSNTKQMESEIQLADSGYGQGQILVNPIHLAALYTGFANQGDVIKPYLLYREEDQREVWIPSAYEPEQAELIENAMKQVLQSKQGTGHEAYRGDVSLAGKTGTAEIKSTKEDKTGTELGWFGVFTTDPNTERPLLLLSMVEDVKGRGGSGYVVGKDIPILNDWFGGAQ